MCFGGVQSVRSFGGHDYWTTFDIFIPPRHTSPRIAADSLRPDCGSERRSLKGET